MGVGEVARESEEGRQEPEAGRQAGREKYAGRSGQTGPASRGAGRTFEHCPLLARQAWEASFQEEAWAGVEGQGRL